MSVHTPIADLFQKEWLETAKSAGRTIAAHALGVAFGYVSVACAAVVAFGMAFLVAIEERAGDADPGGVT